MIDADSNHYQTIINIPGIDPEKLVCLYDNGYIVIQFDPIEIHHDGTQIKKFLLKEKLPFGINKESINIRYKFGQIIVHYDYKSKPEPLCRIYVEK